MQCPLCDSPYQFSYKSREYYEGAGLSNLFLLNVPYRFCPDCKNSELHIPNPLFLYMGISRLLIPRYEPSFEGMRGSEFALLVKYLIGYAVSNVQFALQLGYKKNISAVASDMFEDKDSCTDTHRGIAEVIGEKQKFVSDELAALIAAEIGITFEELRETERMNRVPPIRAASLCSLADRTIDANIAYDAAIEPGENDEYFISVEIPPIA